MRLFRMAVVAVLLGSFFSPAISQAKTEPPVQPVAARHIAASALALANAAASTANAQSKEAAQYAQREQQSQDAQNFKGGALYVYFGSGAALVLLILLLIILV